MCMLLERLLTLPIQTEHLILRDMTIENFDDMYGYVSDPEATQHMFYGPHDPANTRDYIERIITSQTQSPRRTWELAVSACATGRVMGACDLTLENEQEAKLGYIFAQQIWGRGTATEAAQGMVEAGFEQLQLERIYAVCEVGHVASARVLEKVELFSAIERAF
jgi:ribosomal-protein-alanine N-acetyltransferase